MNDETEDYIVNDIMLRLEDEIVNVRGWTKAEFCRLYEETTQNYNNWRKRQLPERHRIKIANFLGLNYEWLVNGKGERYQSGPLHAVNEAKADYNNHTAYESNLKHFKTAFIEVANGLSNEGMHEFIDNDIDELAEIIYSVYELHRNPDSKAVNGSKLLQLIKKR